VTSISPITYIDKDGNVVSLSNRRNTGHLSSSINNAACCHDSTEAESIWGLFLYVCKKKFRIHLGTFYSDYTKGT